MRSVHGCYHYEADRLGQILREIHHWAAIPASRSRRQTQPLWLQAKSVGRSGRSHSLSHSSTRFRPKCLHRRPTSELRHWDEKQGYQIPRLEVWPPGEGAGWWLPISPFLIELLQSALPGGSARVSGVGRRDKIGCRNRDGLGLLALEATLVYLGQACWISA